jgi:hypothetical protein
MRGSIVQIRMTQKRPHYSLNIKGKTKIISLGKGKEAVAKRKDLTYSPYGFPNRKLYLIMTFAITSILRKFLNNHNIKRIYNTPVLERKVHLQPGVLTHG